MAVSPSISWRAVPVTDTPSCTRRAYRLRPTKPVVPVRRTLVSCIGFSCLVLDAHGFQHDLVHSAHIKPLFSQAPAFGSHAFNQLGLFNKAQHGFGQSSRVSGRTQVAMQALYDGRPAAGSIGGD